MALDSVLILLAAALVVCLAAIVLLLGKLRELQAQLSQLSFTKSSMSVKYGKLTEQWIPFSDRFPFSPSKFRFLGNPIDGIVFEDDKVVLCEFKTATSQLNDSQKKIKSLIEQKKVEWLEFKVR